MANRASIVAVVGFVLIALCSIDAGATGTQERSVREVKGFNSVSFNMEG